MKESRNALVGLNDLYSTISDIANIDIPSTSGSAQDSISFANYLKSAEHNEGIRETQSTWRFKKSGNSLKFEARQDNRWKVIRKILNSGGTISSKIEFYDLENDINEVNDLSSDSSFQEIITKMLNELRLEGPCPPGTTGEKLCRLYYDID